MKWYTKTKPDDLQGLIIDETTGANIAVTYDPKGAALIAAAPDLLEAVTRAFHHSCIRSEGRGKWTSKDQLVHEMLKTAMEKARGK